MLRLVIVPVIPYASDAMSTLRPALLAVAALLLVQPEAEELADFIKASYTKYEYSIPMRDGKHLFTAVYVPKDSSHSYAIMLTRTPYSVSPYGVDQYRQTLGPSEAFARPRLGRDPWAWQEQGKEITVIRD